MHKFIYLILAQKAQVNYWHPEPAIKRGICMLLMQKPRVVYATLQVDKV